MFVMLDGIESFASNLSTHEQRSASNGTAKSAEKMKGKHRVNHPTTSEMNYTDDETEFLVRIDQMKTRTGCKFPTYSQIHKELLAMGYTRA